MKVWQNPDLNAHAPMQFLAIFILNPPLAKVGATPAGFFSFYREWKELLFQTKFFGLYINLYFTTLHLTCSFQDIKLPNKRVIALFHHFFLQFFHIAEIGQTPQVQDTLSLAFHKY